MATKQRCSSSPSADPAASPTSPSPSRSNAGPGPGDGGGRCHTAELRASVGRVDPGAGQRNHPVVLTNTSSRTCTVLGYPGAAFVDAGAVQCGFCTPGLVMAVDDLLRGDRAPTELEVREAISGNLCRCTGYGRVVDAVRVAVRRRAGAEVAG